MADAVATVTAPITAPLGWARARPVVFFIFLLIVVLLVIRFRDQLAALLARIPVVGKWLTKIDAAGLPAAATK
jgi:type II secretory pathway component PulF